MKKLGIFSYFAILFGVFLLFFGYAYPIVPFWGDDWQFLSSNASLLPVAHSWIPARLLPPYVQGGIGIISAYVIMPISGLDFIDSVTLTCALLLSSATLLLCLVLYTLLWHITQARSIALFSKSLFVVFGFCASRPGVMPLFLPADLQAEGMGYMLTLIGFYIIPNMLNLAFVCALISFAFPPLTQICRYKNKPFVFLAAGGGVILLYLAQFSITSASFILASYAGIALLARMWYIKSALRHSPPYSKNLQQIKTTPYKNSLSHYCAHFSLYDAILLLILLFFVIASIYDLGSGRAQYCPVFNLSFGLNYVLSSLKQLRSSFYILALLIFLAILILIFFKRDYRAIVVPQILWLLLLVLGYTLLVSKCGAKYYLMSGLFLSISLMLCVWIGLICKALKGARYEGLSLMCIGFCTIIFFLQPLGHYTERPRISYAYHRAYAKEWIKTVQEAENKGQDSVVILVPRNFPHWRWEGWFFPAFSHTLRQFGLITTPIKVRFEPQS